jgi:hypothetical protein
VWLASKLTTQTLGPPFSSGTKASLLATSPAPLTRWRKAMRCRPFWLDHGESEIHLSCIPLSKM